MMLFEVSLKKILAAVLLGVMNVFLGIYCFIYFPPHASLVSYVSKKSHRPMQEYSPGDILQIMEELNEHDIWIKTLSKTPGHPPERSLQIKRDPFTDHILLPAAPKKRKFTLILKGIASGRNHVSVATLRDTKTGRIHFVKTGDKISDAEILQIRKTGILIKFDNRNIELQIK